MSTEETSRLLRDILNKAATIKKQQDERLKQCLLQNEKIDACIGHLKEICPSSDIHKSEDK